MREGRVVEGGDARTILDNPQHPYSILLKSSVLSQDMAGDGGAALAAAAADGAA